MKLANFSRDDMILGGLALLLVIDLLFLPWFSVSLGLLGSADFTATGAPDGWLGVLSVLTALALIADLVIERGSPQTTLPSIGGSRSSTRFILAAVTVGFVALKFLFHIHFSLFGAGFWIAAILSVALIAVAARARRPDTPFAGPVVR